jgi:hypothetical protein
MHSLQKVHLGVAIIYKKYSHSRPIVPKHGENITSICLCFEM